MLRLLRAEPEGAEAPAESFGNRTAVIASRSQFAILERVNIPRFFAYAFGSA
jgi:hypothetical protein